MRALLIQLATAGFYNPIIESLVAMVDLATRLLLFRDSSTASLRRLASRAANLLANWN